MTILEPLSISPAAMAKLRRYNWPGNIRELRNVLERAIIMSDKKRIRSSDVKIVPDGEVPLSVEDTLTTQLVLDDRGSLSETLRNGEKTLIHKALQLCAGNVTRAAKKIGLTREQLKYRMRSLGITRRGKDDSNG
jgi:DNA-binding NtrC family response regulator